MKKDFNQKDIQLYIKKGLTAKDVAEKCGITEEGVFERIDLIYKNAKCADKAKNSLEANAKKARPKATQLPVGVPVEELQESYTTSNTIDTPLKTLSELQEEEATLSSRLIELEIEHKNFLSAHHGKIKELRKYQAELNEIEKSLSKCHEKFEATAEKADELAEKANNLSDVIRERRVALEEVRRELEERTSVVLYVHDDGVIETESQDFVYNDDGWQDLKTVLADKEECSELKNRETATLAKLLQACRETTNITLVCDNSEIEKAFWALRETA